MKTKKHSITVIVCLLLAWIVPEQVFGQDIWQKNSSNLSILKSEDFVIWNKAKRDGSLHVEAAVNGTDTTFTVCFRLADEHELSAINQGEELNIQLDGEPDITLYCKQQANVECKKIRYNYFIGFIPLSFPYDLYTVNPRYDISKEELQRIVDGHVNSLSFAMQGTNYTVNIKSNRLSLATGESCARLKPYDQGDANQQTSIDSKALFGNAKLRRSTLGWNDSFSVSIGMSHLYSRFTDTPFTRQMPNNMFAMDWLLKGCYYGFNVMGKHIEYGDYQLTTFSGKIGPAFKYGNYNSKITFAPYIGLMSCEITNFNNLKIDDVTKFLFGIRTSYVIKHIEMGVNISNRDAGAIIGYNF